LTIAAAESCTAGLVADLLASVSGASAVFWGSFVTYTLDAKTRMLGVDGALLRHYGAVSRETALAMARCAREKSGADAAVSVTGLAGPEGDGSAVPVGSVWIGLSRRDVAEEARLYRFSGSRNEVRRAAARQALECLFQKLMPGASTEVEN
jgi:PncC family amidohydrolase